MKNAIKKTTTVILLLLGLAPSLLAIFFHFQQQAIRHRMEEQLEEKNLHTITIAAQDIRWVEQGREIWYNGHMFDIESCKLENGIYTITGLFDIEETQLVLQMNDWQQHNKKNDDKKLTELINLLLVIFRNEPEVNTLSVSTLSHIHSESASPLPNCYLAVFTPPPQRIS